MSADNVTVARRLILRNRRLAETGMKIDFSQLPLSSAAFSEKPMKFVDPEPKRFLSSVIDLIAIETGRRRARENWQKAQLKNLLKYAHERSAFWRKRLGTRKTSDLELSDLPILTRNDVISQMNDEGPLLRQEDGLVVSPHSTSGSSGTPVKFFISEMNEYYFQARSIAQYLMEGRDLSLNRTRFRPFDYDEAKRLNIDLTKGFTVEVTESWLASLSALFQGGINKHINCWHQNRDLLLEELSKDPIGYLVIQPRILEAVFQDGDFGFLKRHRTEMLIPLAEEFSSDLRIAFAAENIPVRSSYSCEEAGLIGWECEIHPAHYHIAHSNVVVEADKAGRVAVGETMLGRILVTHLHSYATPFIRYDIGDLGALNDACRCGHDGPTLSNIVGRSKNLIKHADGRLTHIHIRARDIMKLTDFDEYRIRQTALDTIVLELGRRGTLTEDQHDSLVKLVRSHAGADFVVDVRAVEEIDWGPSVKRLGFRNELL
jgi:phenylacetate-CoA ligase